MLRFHQFAVVFIFLMSSIGANAQEERIVPAPKAGDYAALASHPDLSGTWLPDLPAVFGFTASANVPWNTAAAAKVKKMQDDLRAGKPQGVHNSCLPLGMPSLMLITHNAMEILATPGRMTVLGEGDGNNLRRIYIDGRKPGDPDPSFHGYSTGRWEKDTLVIDTVAIKPETQLDIDESTGLPLGEGAHISERWHLTDPNTLQVDVELVAPDILTGPWKASRKFFRDRKQLSEIVEGECLESNLDQVDANGHAVFVPDAK